MQTDKPSFIAFLHGAQRTILCDAEDEPSTSPEWVIRRFRQGELLLLSRRSLFSPATVPYRITTMALAFCDANEQPDPGEAVWVMMYNGRILENSQALKGLDENAREEMIVELEVFLTSALITNDDQAHFRGPEAFDDGDWTYLCEQKGDFAGFQGTDTVCYKNVPVFEGSFKGQVLL